MREVMALSVEPKATGDGITIRIASNTGDIGSFKIGLSRIVHELGETAKRGLVCIGSDNIGKLTDEEYRSNTI